MKVVYLYDNLPAYRIDFFSLLSKKLKEQGDEFKVVHGKVKSGKEFSKQAADNLPFDVEALEIRTTNMGVFKMLRIVGLVNKMKAEKPDAIVLQFHVAVISYWFLYFYLKRHHIPYLIWECGFTRETLKSFVVGFRQKLNDYTYRNAASCISYSHYFRNYLLGLGKKLGDVIVAQNTINIEKIIKERNITAEQRTFDHDINILSVGALISRKNVDSSIIAVARLLKENYHIVFDIVGNGPDRERLEAVAKNNQCGDKVVFHGAKYGNDLQVYFEKSDVLVLPGTGGLVINEAMAYGLPILSTKGDDTVPDLLDGNGYLIKGLGDVEAIYEAMKKFLDLSSEEKKKMAIRSEELILELATLENMASKHVEALNHVLKNK